MIAEIIAVGSEMLTPHRQDTNSLFLTAGLNDLGVSVAFKTIVGDNRRHLVSAIRIAISRADIVILSGGLGPTEDDLTRDCLAEVLRVNIHRDTAILNALRARFAARKMAMPANNARQADVLDGAHVLPNVNGSAPGQYIDTVVRRLPQDRHPSSRSTQRAQAALRHRVPPAPLRRSARALHRAPPAPYGAHPRKPGRRPLRSHLLAV